MFGGARFVPNVPFVEAKHDALLGFALGRDGVADGNGFLDETVHQLDVRQELLNLVVRIFIVHVQGNKVRYVQSVLEDLVFPGAKRWHYRPEDPQDETWIVGSTHFMTLPASAAMRPYSVSSLSANLPRTVHFVARDTKT